MYPQPRPYLKPIGTFRFLEDHEVLEATDLIRDTTYRGDPSSDYLDHDSITHLNWCPVKDAIPRWVGVRLGVFKTHMAKFQTRPEVMRRI